MLSPRRLLGDARILVAHASAEGLPIDSAKNDILIEAERKIRSRQFGIEDELKLNAVINELARLIKPATLRDLRPHFAKPARLLRYFRISAVLPIVSIVLVFLVIGLTTNFSQVTSRIAELKTLEQAHYWDKLEHAQRVYAAYLVADKSSQEKSYADFEDEMSKLRDVAGGLGLATAEIRPVIDNSTGGPNWCYLMFNLYGFGSWCSTSALLLVPSSRTQVGQPVTANVGVELVPGQITPPQSAVERPPQSDPQGHGVAPTVSTHVGGGASIPTNLDASNPTAVVQLGKSLRDSVQFAFLFGLNITSPDQMQGAYLSRRQAESVAIFLGSSILPLLYGLLGASVFLMRQLFGEARDAVLTVTTAKAFLRLGLGGIAGLAIGWFWVPDASKSVSEIAKLSTAPFALAFLAGFSIELLFSLLDRIIAALNPASANAESTARPADGKTG